MTSLPLHIDHKAHRLALRRDPSGLPLVEQVAQRDHRPYLHPLRSPDLLAILTEDRPAHHPWQHGLYVGLNDVNGDGFWCEGLHSGHPHDGTFHPAPLAPPQAVNGGVGWEVETVWRAPGGEPLLTERQAWQLVDEGARYYLDLAWTLVAAVDLYFGQYPYGGLFLRMPYTKGVDARVLNDSGAATQPETDTQRARWVAVGMNLPGPSEPNTIAIHDHPLNPEHPVPWRVDGQLGICPSRCIAGAWELGAGDATTSRYRVAVTGGWPQAEVCAADWEAFAGK